MHGPNRAGEETLASWLLEPAAPATIRQRHEAVAELRPRLDLREDLELLGVEVRGGIDPAALAEWSTGDRVFRGKTVFVVATILGVLGTAALVVWIVCEYADVPARDDCGRCCFRADRLGRVKTVLAAVDRRTHDLVLLSELLRRLERETFQSPLLEAAREVTRDRRTVCLGPDPPAGPVARACSITSGTSSSCRLPSSGSGRFSSHCGSTPGAPARAGASATG